MAYRYQQGIAWNIKSHQLRAWDIGYDAAQFGATAQDVSDASPGYFVTRNYLDTVFCSPLFEQLPSPGPCQLSHSVNLSMRGPPLPLALFILGRLAAFNVTCSCGA